MRYLLVPSLLLLTGCGIAAKINAREAYEASTDVYKQCLAANVAAPQRCDGLRLAMEADERKFNGMQAGVSPTRHVIVTGR